MNASEYQRLNDFVEDVKTKTNYTIQVDGHTDNTGLESSNENLSKARAQSVKSFFESAGIRPDRMTMSGWAASKPAADNGDEKNGRALNRRVEVRVIYN